MPARCAAERRSTFVTFTPSGTLVTSTPTERRMAFALFATAGRFSTQARHSSSTCASGLPKTSSIARRPVASCLKVSV